MLESAWLFLGGMALLWTLVCLLIGALEEPGDDALTMLCGVVGFVLWGVWTFGTLEITVISNGSEFTFAHSELTFVGVLMAIVPGFLALTGPFELVTRAQKGDIDEL